MAVVIDLPCKIPSGRRRTCPLRRASSCCPRNICSETNDAKSMLYARDVFTTAERERERERDKANKATRRQTTGGVAPLIPITITSASRPRTLSLLYEFACASVRMFPS